MSVTAYIALGSNLGDRKENIDRALEMLRNWPGIEVTNFSLVLRYYPGEGMAVTSNTDSIEHLIAAGGYTSGLDKNVNVKYAQQLLASAPKCKH